MTQMKFKDLAPKFPVCVVFFVVLFLPLLNGVFHFVPGQALPEEREKVIEGNLKSDSVSRYTRQYGRNFENNFFLRGELIRFHNILKYRLFGISGVPKVIAGRNGWLFQARENEKPGTAGYFPSVRPFTTGELERWRLALEERYLWLKERGIDYLFIPVPDKSSIYPEYLPPLQRSFYERSRLDQLVTYLRMHSAVPVLDVRGALLEAKKEFPVYYKTDSHWNEYGACVVALETANRLSARCGKSAGLKVPDFRIKTGRERPGGNLAMMLSLENSIFKEKRVKMISRVSLRAEKAELPSIPFSRTVVPEAYRGREDGFPQVVMFHDSFGRKLKPFLSGFFSRILYIRDWGFRFHVDVIEAERPAVVLDEIAEHFLYNVQLVNNL
jgi:alginate O-acetyltransferase complex protein AlgJ